MKDFRRIICTLIALAAADLIFAQEKMYTQDSILVVMGTKHETEITFYIEENQITVLPFSYNEKEIGQFTLALTKVKDGKQKGKLIAENTSVQAVGKDKTTELNVISASLDMGDDGKNCAPEFSMKFKPGKMPFPITLAKRGSK